MILSLNLLVIALLISVLVRGAHIAYDALHPKH